MSSIPNARPHIQVQQLTLQFEGKVILEAIDLTVARGERIFVVGPSGTGKSRLLRAVAHLDYHPGHILLSGRDVQAVGAPGWRRAVAYLGDTPSHFSDSSLALYARALAFGSQRCAPVHATPAAADAALVDLSAELGIERSVLDQPWHSLSAGQRQRLGLAIGIALSPEVLLLDEPTSHLDRESTLRFEDVIRRSPCTVIWVSHSEDQVKRLGGRILTLPEGTFHEQPPVIN